MTIPLSRGAFVCGVPLIGIHFLAFAKETAGSYPAVKVLGGNVSKSMAPKRFCRDMLAHLKQSRQQIVYAQSVSLLIFSK